MHPKKLLFVYNPVAGRGKIQKNMFEVVDFYDSQGFIVTMCPVLKLYEYKDALFKTGEYDRIICSGGDGTLNGLMNFLIRNDIQIDVGYLPSGSTNDYANSLQINGSLKKVLGKTVDGTPHLLDIGLFNDRYFLYVAAFGLFANVSYATPQSKKNLLGHTAYILEGISQLSEVTSYKISVETDREKIDGSFILGLIANSFSVGGFKNILPGDSALDDGEFEVMLIKKPENIAVLYSLIKSLTRNVLEDNPDVVTLRCSHIKITSKEPIEWALDGEFGGKVTDASITNINRRFSVIF